MSAKTNNIYGKIMISSGTIQRFVHSVALDCYGIVGFASLNLWESIVSFVKFRSELKGVKVRTIGNRISIDVSVEVKYGVSIKAVTEALKESLKYKVERFTGMVVETINVKVSGVKR